MLLKYRKVSSRKMSQNLRGFNYIHETAKDGKHAHISLILQDMDDFIIHIW